MPDLPLRALIVTLGRARGALAAVRALGGAGWMVGVGTPDGGGMVAASRWCSARHVVARPRGDGTAFVDGVRAAVEKGGYSVVFGGADDWVAALATKRDRIAARVAHPCGSTVEASLDKHELSRRAAKAGFQVPETEVASAEVLAGWDGPVVVKCRSHWRPGQQHAYRIEARRYPGAAAAAGRVRMIEDAGLEPLVQRPVNGRLGALIGLFADGRLLGRVQQRTYGLWPTPSGVSARAATVPVDESLAARATGLLADLGWSGLVELQFLTGYDGVPYLIDLNGRFYGSMALASAAGPNLPDAWARQAMGLPLPPLADGRPRVRYSWAAGDLRRAFAERRGVLVTDVSSTLRWAAGSTTSVWAQKDPGPLVHLLTSRFRPGRAGHAATAVGTAAPAHE
jgi:predicted ATP-grasp superfamily ATP-dependent carboligase